MRVAAMIVALIGGLAHASAAQELEPAFRADVEKLLEITGAGSTGAQIATLIIDQMIASMKQRQQVVPDQAFVIIRDVLSKEFANAFVAPDGLRPQLVAIYGRNFTHDEVKELIAFYDTPIGRKTLSVLPKLAQESALAGQAWSQANMPRITKILEQRLREEKLIP